MDAVTNKRIYTIDAHNVIAGDQSNGTEVPDGTVAFTSESELQSLGADWPSSRLLDIWSRLPNTTPVTKFTNRKTAIRRIWKALESGSIAETAEERVLPVKGRKAKGRTRTGTTGATKSETVLALLRQSGGATLKALMAATGWQAHSVRGFISGQLTKRMRLKVKSFRRDGERVYTIRT
jgi:hypothetical protein